MTKIKRGGQQQRVVAKYRLVIYFKEGKQNNTHNAPRVFYSYYTYDQQGERGKKQLEYLVKHKYKGLYTTALLYDNKTGYLLGGQLGRIRRVNNVLLEQENKIKGTLPQRPLHTLLVCNYQKTNSLEPAKCIFLLKLFMTMLKLEGKNLSILTAEYKVSRRTMKKWLRKVPDLVVDNRETREYTPKEVEMIYRHLGAPGMVFEEGYL